MLREQGDLDAALATLLEFASMMESFSKIGLRLAYLAIARLYMNRHDWPAAQSYLDKARQRAQASQFIWMDDQLVEITQVRYWIARGELDLASQRARQRNYLDRAPARSFGADKNASVRELLQGEALTLTRLYLGQHRSEKALEMLNYLHDQVKKRGQMRRVIEVLALKALALQKEGQLDLALQAIGEALALAEPEGYQRAFVDEGEPMGRLLYQAVAKGIFPVYSGKLLAVLSVDFQAPVSSLSLSQAGLIEPLSEREQDVLQLLAEGLRTARLPSACSFL